MLVAVVSSFNYINVWSHSKLKPYIREERAYDLLHFRRWKMSTIKLRLKTFRNIHATTDILTSNFCLVSSFIKWLVLRNKCTLSVRPIFKFYYLYNKNDVNLESFSS